MDFVIIDHEIEHCELVLNISYFIVKLYDRYMYSNV